MSILILGPHHLLTPTAFFRAVTCSTCERLRYGLRNGIRLRLRGVNVPKMHVIGRWPPPRFIFLLLRRALLGIRCDGRLLHRQRMITHGNVHEVLLNSTGLYMCFEVIFPEGPPTVRASGINSPARIQRGLFQLS